MGIGDLSFGVFAHTVIHLSPWGRLFHVLVHISCRLLVTNEFPQVPQHELHCQKLSDRCVPAAIGWTCVLHPSFSEPVFPVIRRSMKCLECSVFGKTSGAACHNTKS